MRRPQPRTSSLSGFTLVELLVAAVVMLLTTIGSTTMFNQSTRQGIDINRHLHEQFAISDDLAAILELNERYSCVSGTCQAILPDAQGGVLPSPPDQDHYAPADIDAIPGSGGKSFRQLCTQGLLTHLITAIGSKQLGETQVNRTVSLLDVSGASTGSESLPPHRYRVDWTDREGHLLRQVQLIPTVAAWCP